MLTFVYFLRDVFFFSVVFFLCDSFLLFTLVMAAVAVEAGRKTIGSRIIVDDVKAMTRLMMVTKMTCLIVLFFLLLAIIVAECLFPFVFLDAF